MQVDSKNNLILNIKNKTQIYSTEEVRKALEEYEKNKIAINEVSFCANHDRDTQEAINEYYKSHGDFMGFRNNEKTTDPIVDAVREDLLKRSQVGISKYKVTLARTDLSLKDWSQHLYEEILDSANYLKKIIMELESKKTDNLLDVHEMD